MKRIVVALFALLPALTFAAGGHGVHLNEADYDLSDKASLQNGAKLFMNYCSGCHSTQYQRYNRVAQDLDIPEEVMQANLNFTGAAIGELMENAIPEADAANWFGAAPPDLTLVARVRGADWLYTYLRYFYKDDSRPFGVNNLVFPSVGMPHVLEPLQGSANLEVTRLVKRDDVWVTEDGSRSLTDKELKQAMADSQQVSRSKVKDAVTGEDVELVVLGKLVFDGNGELNQAEYDQAVLDIVNFLVYSGEPIKLERQRIGYWVLGFLVIFFIIAYLLKKEYWRDVH